MDALALLSFTLSLASEIKSKRKGVKAVTIDSFFFNIKTI